MSRAYFTPEMGQRVVCTISPNADGSLDAGTIVEVIRQRYTDDLVRVVWDSRLSDDDLYSTNLLALEPTKVTA